MRKMSTRRRRSRRKEKREREKALGAMAPGSIRLLREERAASPTTSRSLPGTNDELIREIAGISATDNERQFELSFSSEEPYQRWFGVEILDHDPESVDLSRLNDIGVLLFNHERDEVIGKIDRAWIEAGRGKAIVTLDDDEASEKIRKKMESGTLKGVSVGYMVDVWESVAAGAVSTNGKHQGPCEVATRWTPFEISIVSVPADPTVGVGRSMDAPPIQSPCSVPLSVWEKQVGLNLLGLEV